MTDVNTPTSWDELFQSGREDLIKEKWNEVLKTLDIPQELKDFRERWKNINISDDKKKAIIEAVDKIPHRATIESDWSRFVEFKLWWKTYQCLDINLAVHSDSYYLSSYEYNRQTNNEVELSWMWWDDTAERENKKLAEYIEKQKNNRGMKIPTIELQRNLINKLWKEARLTKESDKIAMWIYLTWNYGCYWLSMWNGKKSNSQADSRSILCSVDDLRRHFNFIDDNRDDASLCLIATSS